jgi:hypothetical protein
MMPGPGRPISEARVPTRNYVQPPRRLDARSIPKSPVERDLWRDQEIARGSLDSPGKRAILFLCYLSCFAWDRLVVLLVPQLSVVPGSEPGQTTAERRVAARHLKPAFFCAEPDGTVGLGEAGARFSFVLDEALTGNRRGLECPAPQSEAEPI